MHDLRPSFEDHLPGLRRYARSLVNDSAESDDLVQECILHALSAPHLWPRIRNVRAYLFTVLHHAHADSRNSQRRWLSTATLEQLERQLPIQSNQEARLEFRDMARALTSLSEEQRNVVLLVALHGVSYEEVGRQLFIPIGTVMSRLFRARNTSQSFMTGQARKSRRGNKRIGQFAPA